MTTNLTIQKGNSSDAYLKRIFSWLSRIGASPKFGSRPIGWYQIHQMKVVQWLESKADGRQVRCKFNSVECKTSKGWMVLASVSELYNIGDSRS